MRRAGGITRKPSGHNHRRRVAPARRLAAAQAAATLKIIPRRRKCAPACASAHHVPASGRKRESCRAAMVPAARHWASAASMSQNRMPGERRKYRGGIDDLSPWRRPWHRAWRIEETHRNSAHGNQPGNGVPRESGAAGSDPMPSAARKTEARPHRARRNVPGASKVGAGSIG